MAITTLLIWTLVLLIIHPRSPSVGQDLGLEPYQEPGICKSCFCNSLKSLQRLNDCVVILGNLNILLFEKTQSENFTNLSFPKLREVTGFLLVYRVRGLGSLGQLFPNLARIRGNEVLGNYGLIVHDMQNLLEIGLYNLVKIDRGGVVVLASPMVCFVHTVDWKSIAPWSRHVLRPSASPAPNSHCKRNCRCPADTPQYCWNDRKCQRFVSGPHAESCHEECLGCGQSPTSCTVCRHRTHRGRCVRACPPDTLLLEANEYCLTASECEQLQGWPWRGRCVTACPAGYEQADAGNRTCVPCSGCEKVCSDLHITTLESMQEAENCVIVNGSLTIYVRAVPEAMVELGRALRLLRHVVDYVAIYGSQTITSLHFLPSLRRIQGRKLLGGRYSLSVHGMTNLTSLFPVNVTKNLKIEQGTLHFFDNPELCVGQIHEIAKLFTKTPNMLDVPQGMNGYGADCKEVSMGLKVSLKNESTATVLFMPQKPAAGAHYTVLFSKLPARLAGWPAPAPAPAPAPVSAPASAPERCSDSDWFSITTKSTKDDVVTVDLHNLQPSSCYAVCIETYDPLQMNLARSSIVYFYTPVGKPAPPFINELVAFSDDAVLMRWSDHEDYRIHITHYKVDVSLIEVEEETIAARNYCRHHEEEDYEPSRHEVVSRPPPEYDTACPAGCGARASRGSAPDEWLPYETCAECTEYEIEANTTHAQTGYIRTAVFYITGPRQDYQIRGLAPYSDYRFRIRSCTDKLCSQTTQGVVRTLRSEEADTPSDLSASANEMGELTVSWNAPEIYNGAILAYYVQIMVEREEDEVGYPAPRSWCVLSGSHELRIHLEAATSYYVRVCAASLAVEQACGGWTRAEPRGRLVSQWWYIGIIVGITIWLSSVLISGIWKPKHQLNDEVPLIDSTSIHRSCSEPPDVTTSDFTPLYLIN